MAKLTVAQGVTLHAPSLPRLGQAENLDDDPTTGAPAVHGLSWWALSTAHTQVSANEESRLSPRRSSEGRAHDIWYYMNVFEKEQHPRSSMSERFTETFLSTILTAYPLAEPRLLRRLDGSNLNDNFLVADGPSLQYVLRHYRRNPQEDRVAFQLRFQEHLLRCRFPTPPTFKTASGSSFLASRENLWALSAYVEGTPYDPARMEQTLEAARRLAQFHTLAETFPGRDVPVAANAAVTRWWAPGAQRLAELGPLFAGQNVAAELDHLRDWLAATMSDWPLERLQALPAGWVHSDYHGHNMVFVHDQMRGLFDFDMLRRDLLIRDVARALPTFSRDSPGRTPLRPEVAQAFVQEYARHRPLATEEWEAIPMMMALDRLPIPGHYTVFQRDGADLAARLRNDIELMRFLQSEGERLRPLLME